MRRRPGINARRSPLVSARPGQVLSLRGGILQRTGRRVKAVETSPSMSGRRGLRPRRRQALGKTTTGRLLLRLIEPTRGGRSRFEGRDPPRCRAGELKKTRSDIADRLPDPYASLNPGCRSAGSSAKACPTWACATGASGGAGRRHPSQRSASPLLHNRYPHEFRAPAPADRPRPRARPAAQVRRRRRARVGPDVSIQSQVLKPDGRPQGRAQAHLSIISHNLSVVEHISDRVGVMYLGKLWRWPPPRTSSRPQASLHPFSPSPPSRSHPSSTGSG